jgi:hypothetical protein
MVQNFSMWGVISIVEGRRYHEVPARNVDAEVPVWVYFKPVSPLV